MNYILIYIYGLLVYWFIGLLAYCLYVLLFMCMCLFVFRSLRDKPSSPGWLTVTLVTFTRSTGTSRPGRRKRVTGDKTLEGLR